MTIADITDAVGVSRRTFSNYFAGKAECVAAVTEGWFDDIVDIDPLARRPTAGWTPCSSTPCSRFAADLPERWDRFYGLFHDEPELKAMADAMDEPTAPSWPSVIAPRLGMAAGRHPGADARDVRAVRRPHLPRGLGAPRTA